MRIESFDSLDTKTGMREISSKYGGDVLIISNSRLAGKNRFVIAVDKEKKEEKETSGIGDFSNEAKDIFISKIRDVEATLTSKREDISLVKELIEYIRSEFDHIKSSFTEDSHHTEKAGPRIIRELLENSFVSMSLLKRLEMQVENCNSKADVLGEISRFLQKQIPGVAQLPRTPALHMLAGGHGAGKTLCAVRMARHIVSACKHSAIAVSYKPGQNGSWAQMQLLGAKLGVEVYCAGDFSTLLNIINENMQFSSIAIELPGNMEAEELAELQHDLPFAQFHLVVPKGDYATSLQYPISDGNLRFASVLVTRLDRQGAYWPLLNLLIDNKIPLLLGSASENVATPFIELEKNMIIQEVLHDMQFGKEKEL